MRKLSQIMQFFVLVCVALVFSCAMAAQEYKRPTADATTTVGTDCFGASPGTNDASASQSGVYTSKSGAGPSGTANTMADTGTTIPRYQARAFSTWQTTSNTYTALTLYASVGCSTTSTQGVGGRCGASYSTNGGSTWTNLYSYVSSSGGTDAQHTVSVVITGTALTSVQVRACAQGASSGTAGDTGTISVYDIWTAGTISGQVYSGLI